MTTIVTGGTRGIGAAITRALVADGHEVVASYARDGASAEALADELGVQVVRADVTTTEGLDALFAAAERVGPLTGLVNNAGATLHIGPLAKTDPDLIRSVIDLNLTATVLCARRAVQAMTGRGGTIVNISSGAATLGSPGEYVHYAAAKAGVDALTLGLGKEVAPLGIRVVGVAPGMIRTDIHADAGDPGRPNRVADRVPLGRAGEPDDVSGVVAWLFRPEAAYVTATTIRVTGGL